MGLLSTFQRSLIYLPDTSTPRPAGDVIAGAEDITLHTEDGLDLDAWLVPPSAGADRDMAVLYLPGNGGNREGRAGIAQLLSERGFTVLMVDYRGYGGNPGSPSEEGTGLDALAAIQALDEAGFPLHQVIYFGESIGTGVAARLQTVAEPAGVVLRSPFTDLAAVASRQVFGLPVGWLLKDRYPVVEDLSRTDVPVTVIYGDDDTIVPAALSEEVAASAPNLVEKLEVAGNHNDAVMFGAEVADAVVRLAEKVAP